MYYLYNPNTYYRSWWTLIFNTSTYFYMMLHGDIFPTSVLTTIRIRWIGHIGFGAEGSKKEILLLRNQFRTHRLFQSMSVTILHKARSVLITLSNTLLLKVLSKTHSINITLSLLKMFIWSPFQNNWFRTCILKRSLRDPYSH